MTISAPLLCPTCGQQTNAGSAFCAACGTAMSGAVPSPGIGGGHIPSPTEIGRRIRLANRTKMVVGAVVALVAIAGLGLVMGGFVFQKPSPAQVAQQALAANRARLLVPLTDAMRLRDDLFTSERSYLSSMADATSLITKFQKQTAKVQADNKQMDLANAPAMANCRTYSFVTCPTTVYEVYPAAPDVTADVTKLQGAVTAFNTLHARLLNINPQPELKILNAQMLSSIESLTSNANQNARVLTQAITPAADGGTGSVDANQIKTLSGNDALASIVQMNHAAVGVIALLHQPIGNFDVMGGHDIDPSDHSTSM